MAADTSVIRLDQVVRGTYLQVRLSAPTNLSRTRFTPNINGIARVETGGSLKFLNQRSVNKISLFRRNFIGLVLINDTTEKEINMEVQGRKRIDLYRIIVPYSQIFRVSRLVHQARTLTIEEETARRITSERTTTVSRFIFHPTSRFVPVSVVV